MYMDFGLKGRKVLITGGTSGIGAGIAQAFCSQGAIVMATGASASEVDAATNSAVLKGIEFHVLDVRDAAATSACIAGLKELDVLVNCAGILKRGGVEHDPAEFANVIDINLNGTMRMCSAARPLLKVSAGCIINTASMLSFFGGSLVPGYAASKGGVMQLTKSLAIAYAEDGIRVNAVAPGWIATPLTAALQQDPDRSDDILRRTPMRRWGTPADVADPVLFLASQAARFVTGVILPVDGGYLIN
jgi:NAD(P)-dependent dehydrogenase (short-subunit alcohol dehydrogenase family)